MKQETIERLRAEYELTKEGRLEPTGQVWHRWWPPFVREVGEAFPDILAVLEAARDYAEKERKYRGAYSTKNAAAMINANAALLALIDLGSTE